MRRPNLAAERARKGLTMQQVADAIGVARKTYESWESKGSPIASDYILSLSDFFGISDLNYLIQTSNDFSDIHKMHTTD